MHTWFHAQLPKKIFDGFYYLLRKPWFVNKQFSRLYAKKKHIMIVVERERGWVSIWACRRPSLCHCAAAVEVAATPPLRRAAAAAYFSCPLYMPVYGAAAAVAAASLRCPSLPSHALLCPGEKCKYIHSKLLESTAFVLVPSQYGVHHWVVGQRLITIFKIQ